MRRPRLLIRGPFSATYVAETVSDEAALRHRLAEGWRCDGDAIATAQRGGHLLFIRPSHLRRVSIETPA